MSEPQPHDYKNLSQFLDTRKTASSPAWGTVQLFNGYLWASNGRAVGRLPLGTMTHERVIDDGRGFLLDPTEHFQIRPRRHDEPVFADWFQVDSMTSFMSCHTIGHWCYDLSMLGSFKDSSNNPAFVTLRVLRGRKPRAHIRIRDSLVEGVIMLNSTDTDIDEVKMEMGL